MSGICNLKGMTQHIADKYGAQLIEIITNYSEESSNNILVDGEVEFMEVSSMFDPDHIPLYHLMLSIPLYDIGIECHSIEFMT